MDMDITFEWLKSPRNHSKRIEPEGDHLCLAYKGLKSDEINWNVGRWNEIE